MAADKFVLITKGNKDSNDKGVVRLTPRCYDIVRELKCRSGLSMCAVLEQCVDFALEHLDTEEV